LLEIGRLAIRRQSTFGGALIILLTATASGRAANRAPDLQGQTWCGVGRSAFNAGRLFRRALARQDAPAPPGRRWRPRRMNRFRRSHRDDPARSWQRTGPRPRISTVRRHPLIRCIFSAFSCLFIPPPSRAPVQALHHRSPPSRPSCAISLSLRSTTSHDAVRASCDEKSQIQVPRRTPRPTRLPRQKGAARPIPMTTSVMHLRRCSPPQLGRRR